MGAGSIEQFLWAAGLAGHAALLFVLVRRHQAQRFPIFTFLIGYNILQTLFLFGLYQKGSNHQQYVYFWWTQAFGYVLEVAFIFELALAVMQASGRLTKQAFRLFLSWSGVGVLLAALISQALTARGASGLDLWDMRATYFATCLTCFLYLAMLRAVNFWRLPWQSHVMTLGQGFAVWQFVSTFLDSVHIWSGWRWADKAFDDVGKSVYLGVLLFWIVRLSFPERDSYIKISPESEVLILILARRADNLDLKSS